jgi:SAM-dependent methyltransferase
MMRMLSRFLSANRRLCAWIDDRLPADFKPHLRSLHRHKVAELLNARPGQVVLEVGAGRESAFFRLLADKQASLIIGMDISPTELSHNRELAAKVVADAAASAFPVGDDCVDLITSHSVVEHLPDSATFFANCARVLRPGGMIVHTLPCKFAPFSLINQLIPNWLARRLLAWFHPDWRQEAVGFPAFYHHCHYSGIQNLLLRNGFHDETYIFRYSQAEYFDFFFPLYLIMLAYDLAVWRLGIRNLASGIVMTAQRSSDPPLSRPSVSNGGRLSRVADARWTRSASKPQPTKPPRCKEKASPTPEASRALC